MKQPLLVLCFLTCPLIPAASGQCYETDELTASDAEALDRFGQAVSVSGEVAVVGAYLDDDNGDSSGSAYVFRWNGAWWQEEQKLLAWDGAIADGFGYDVSVSGDVAAISAKGDDAGRGSVYVFHWNGEGWDEEQKLQAADPGADFRFGDSVSASGDVIVVGSDYSGPNGFRSGSAYVFRWNGTSWVQEQKLVPSDGSEQDLFGVRVAVWNDVIVVGAAWDDDNGEDSGSAYVFRWNGATWLEEQKLLPSDGAAGDYFFPSAVSEDTIVVGASLDDDNGDGSGSAYVFRWNGVSWDEEQKLIPQDGSVLDRFGSFVSVSGDLILIGANEDDDNGQDSGAAYVFRWSGSSWVQERKLLPSDGSAGDNFGYPVSVSGDIGLVGAWPHDIHGAAYMFELGLYGSEIAASHFDSGPEGWYLTGDPTTFMPEWLPVEGNPGGCIQATDRQIGALVRFNAPSRFLGNILGSYGYILSFDLQQEFIGSQGSDSDPELRLYGGGLALVIDAGPNPAFEPDWSRYVVTLTESAGWRISDANGPAPTKEEFETVLSSLDSLQIVGEFSGGEDHVHLDNVILRGDPCDSVLGDLDGDGDVDLVDFAEFQVSFGASCHHE